MAKVKKFIKFTSEGCTVTLITVALKHCIYRAVKAHPGTNALTYLFGASVTEAKKVYNIYIRSLYCNSYYCGP
jgi:hypothetical protein